MRRVLRALAAMAVVWFLAGVPAQSPAQFETGPFGGFAVEAWGSGLSMIYDDPNGPVPAHPQGEMHAAYALATLSDGPSGHGVASELWPGGTAATALPFIEDSFWDQVEEESEGQFPPEQLGRPSLAPKQWPVAAEVFEPNGPHTHDVPPNAHSHSSDDTVYAKAASVPLSLPGVFTADVAAATSEVTARGDTVRSTVVSTVTDVTIPTPVGAIAIDKVTTTATVRSDGEKPVIEGETVVSGLTINGQGYVLDGDGLHAGGETHPNPVLEEFNAGMEEALGETGISITLIEEIDLTEGPTGSRSVGGVIVHMTAERMEDLVAALPEPLQGEVRQRVSTTHDFRLILGAANVKASALKAFVFETEEFPIPTGGDFGSTDVLGSTVGGGDFGGDDLGSTGAGPVAGGGGRVVTGSPAFAGPIEVDGVSVAAFLLGLAAVLAAARGLKALSDKALLAGAAAACPLGEEE